MLHYPLQYQFSVPEVALRVNKYLVENLMKYMTSWLSSKWTASKRITKRKNHNSGIGQDGGLCWHDFYVAEYCEQTVPPTPSPGARNVPLQRLHDERAIMKPPCRCVKCEDCVAFLFYFVGPLCKYKLIAIIAVFGSFWDPLHVKKKNQKKPTLWRCEGIKLPRHLPMKAWL
jgi:hypothetical protein